MAATSENDILGVIPAVEAVELKEGSFPLKDLGTIAYRTGDLEETARLLASYLDSAAEGKISLAAGTPSSGPAVTMALSGTPAEHEMGFPDESYEIRIGQKEINLSAPHRAGIARAVQTLRQLAALSSSLPAVTIKDRPRFPWRGMHVDVSRHFFTKEEIFRFIDGLALFRFNKLHLHLTDDQGWRPQIGKYPRLTEVGAWREATLVGHYSDKPHRFDDKRYGGFYTREDMEEMVAYARQREIDIIPEIDMPGHMQAAIAAYPELGCTDMTMKTRCHWGISQHILNAGESTVSFMKDVLDEIMEVFPSTFIHVGGDEAHKYEWEEQRHIQERMAELGLESEDELQSWFISQMGEHLKSRGRRMIGWDEILEGGLADGAIVMSWRGEEGGVEAARKGAPVINCTCTHTYFDYYQGPATSEPLAIGGDLPLEKVYAFEPVPADIPDSKKHLVMGSQGQLWTEYIGDYSQLEYMAFPRALALSECLWRRPEEKDWNSFRARLKGVEEILAGRGMNFRKNQA